MPLETFDDLKKRLSGDTNVKVTNPLKGFDSAYTLTNPNEPLKLKPVAYDVPNDAIFDRLSDGSYVAKFENYKGATGNENRLAKEQSVISQIGYGLGKNIAKIGTYALDATVGTVYGVFNGISDGKFSSIWDNDVSNKLDDWNKQLDYNLPNYYTDEQKSKNVLQSIGTANFWFNDVANGFAFVAGALLPELAIGAATGGTSLAIGAGQLGAAIGRETVETGLKQVAKKAVSKIDDTVNFSKGRNVIRDYQRAIYGKQVGDVISTSGFLLRTSNFEAGMEARNNFKNSITDFYQSFQDKNGRPPTFSEASEFTNTARVSANGLYAANLAILSVSNAAMFGKAFNLKLPHVAESANSFTNRITGLGTKIAEDGTTVLKGANKLQKITGNAYQVLSKPIIEGVYEEGLQGVAGKTMQNYLENQYDPKSSESYSMWAGLTDAFAEQYGSKEGWKEMGIGMIVGFAGGGVTGQGLPGFGRNSRKAKENALQTNLDAANEGLVTLKNMNRAASVRNFRNATESKIDKYESSAVENTAANINFIKSQEHIKSPTDIQQDFESVVDNMVLDTEQIDELKASKIDVEAYKQALKTEFNQNIEDYSFARKAVEAVGLNRNIETSPGNIENIGEAMVMNIVLGKNALRSAQNTAKQIDQLIAPGDMFQSGGIFDNLQFYNNLKSDKKKAVQTLKRKQTRLSDLQNAAFEVQQQLAGLQNRPKENEALNKKYNSLAQKAVVIQQQIVQTQNEQESLSKSIDLDFTAVNYDLDGTLSTNPTNILSALEEIDKLDLYVNSLRNNGKDYEADSLEYLIQQFKFHSDSHREMTNTHRKMLATGFFQTKQGKTLVSKLIGEKYQMSEDFRKSIEDNNEIIDKSLQLFGIRGYETVEAKIKETIEDNENLSDREKFKLESLIRIQLNMKAIEQKLQDITSINVEFNAEKEITPSVPKGDTVRLKQSIVNRDLNNIDVINQTIKEVTEQLRLVLNPDSTNRLEAELTDLLTKQKQFTENSALITEVPNINTTEHATQNNQEQKQEDNPEGNFSQYSGVDQGQQDQEQTTEQGADNSNSDISSQEKEKIKQRIKEIKKELEGKSLDFEVTTLPEYPRFYELALKKETTSLNPDEKNEFEELEKEINQWFLISGVVVEGMRLSDLIRQKIVLENTEIAPVEQVEEIIAQDILSDINFTDKTANVNYTYGQTYDSVTAVKDGDFISVSGIKAATLIQEVGFTFDFETNERNNILLTEDVVEKINRESSISILPTNSDLTTNYSIVIKHGIGLNGETQSNPVKSNYNDDFTQAQNPDATYALQKGDSVTLEVDPNDDYNKELLSEYKNSLGKSPINLDEDSLELLIDQTQTELGEKDEEYQALLKKEEELKLAVQKADTIDKTNTARKELLKFNNSGKLNRKEDQLRTKAEKAVEKQSRQQGTPAKPNDEIKEKLKKSLLVRVKDSEGNFIAVLKAKSSSGNKTFDDQSFEAFRNSLIDNEEMFQSFLNSTTPVELDLPSIEVKKIFLGHPNFNFIKNEDGTVGIQYRKISSSDISKITDIGYVEEGVLNTKSNIKGIDTTFLQKFLERTKGDKKVPFVVFEKNGKKIAYPVRLIPNERPDNTDLTTVYNSDLDVTTKVNNLNKILADRGIDIKQPGNAFTALGNTNLTQEFLDQKLAQLDAINYYAPLSEWVNSEDNLESILSNQVLININLSNPLHSPKVQLDFKNVFKQTVAEKVTMNPETVAKDIVNKKSKDISSKALEELRKNC